MMRYRSIMMSSYSDSHTTTIQSRLASESSPSPKSTWLVALLQTPRHCPQADEHSMSCFLQVHLLDEQSVLQLHLTISRSSGGATSFSVRMGKYCPPSIFQPQSSGLRFLSRPIHCCTWKYVLKLWNLAAADVGGSTWGSTNDLLIITFWWKYWNLRRSSDTHGGALYRMAKTASPAATMSALVLLGLVNTWAWSWKVCQLTWVSEGFLFQGHEWMV